MVDVRTNIGVSTRVLRLNKKLAMDAYRSEAPGAMEEGKFRVSEYNQSAGRWETPTALFGSRKRVVLPSSYTGGPCQMYKTYQDSMAIVREFGKSDIFLTKTCSPEWKEIRDQIAEHQNSPDRPTSWRLSALLHDLDEGVLGRILARIYVVEFQKRGLPLAHILIILAEEAKPRTRDLITKLVSCEIPVETPNPEL
ncbi:LOW QUALITY PROTEIN: Helitron helicase [Phytophthora megakarya]|uniref:Helitron helicase n=1 Tax=Phytophthora megakarya TaxID=4795 RepID=A0A225WJ40_9STRA|nr:LOW QUALITY PROTEIN: Helitron helicase [Phytophthora megakarya]